MAPTGFTSVHPRRHAAMETFSNLKIQVDAVRMDHILAIDEV